MRACANGIGSRCERRRDGVPACACRWSMGLSTLSESLLLSSCLPVLFFFLYLHIIFSCFMFHLLSLILKSVLRLTLPLLTPQPRTD